MQFQIKTFRFGLPAMLITAVVVLPLVLVFFIFFALWGLVARILLGRSFSRTLKGNTIFTRTMGEHWSKTSANSDMTHADVSSDKPVIEVEGHVVRDDTPQR